MVRLVQNLWSSLMVRDIFDFFICSMSRKYSAEELWIAGSENHGESFEKLCTIFRELETTDEPILKN